MDVAKYLDRIGYKGSIAPDLQTLCALHRAHMLAVPFENLNILLKRPLVLDEQALYHKVVECRRGGFCYELNGLFGVLLREIGFKVDYLSARVWDKDHFTQDFDHMTLLVHLPEGNWLADVGFGDCFLEPLRFVADEEQVRNATSYRLVRQDDHWLLQEKNDDQAWQPQYLFSTKPYALTDFAPMCEWQQNSPDSGFNKRRICSRATDEGRVTISEHKLILTKSGERHELSLEDDEAVTTALKEHFDVDLSLI